MVTGLRRLRDRYDAILLDLDGTLLDGRGRLTPRTHRAVRALVDAGLLVVLCTGRSVAGTRPHHEALELTTPLVAYNGSWIGLPDADPQHYLAIPDRLMAALARAEGEAHFSFRHHAEWKYTVMTDHPEHHDVARWYERVVRADRPDALPSDGILRMSLFVDERRTGMDDFERRFWGRMPTGARGGLRIEIFPLNLFPDYEDSAIVLFEVQGRSRGKAEALDWLERAHGIPAGRTIAVGDHMNDVSMLEAAGLAVAPANGVAPVRRRAHLVIGHHADEGVAEWIEHGAPHDPPARTPGAPAPGG